MKTRLAMALALVLPCFSITTQRAEARPRVQAMRVVAPTKRVPIDARDQQELKITKVGTHPTKLRFAPTVGQTQSLAMTMGMSMKMEMNGQTIDVKTPPTVAKMTGKVDSIRDGVITAGVGFDSMRVEEAPGVDPQLVTKLREMFAGFKSFYSSVEFDDRGVVQGGYTDVPQNLPPAVQQVVDQIQQNIGQLAVPLPQGPVGVGGSWVAVTRVEQGGLKLEQTVTYELVERQATRVKLKAVVTQRLLSKDFNPPTLPPGASATIESYRGGGTGEVELDLASVMPIRSKMHVDVAMTIELAMGPLKQTQKMGVSSTFKLVRTP